jgi:hypothetical protein
MPAEPTGGDHISGDFRGANVQGQVAVGSGIQQQQTAGDMTIEVTAAEMEELRAAFASVREEVAAAAPPEQKDAALERIDELQAAVEAEKPDLTTMQYVGRWFRKNLPHVAGSVVGLIVHPIVGKLVEKAGELAADGLANLVGAED